MLGRALLCLLSGPSPLDTKLGGGPAEELGTGEPSASGVRIGVLEAADDVTDGLGIVASVEGSVVETAQVVMTRCPTGEENWFLMHSMLADLHVSAPARKAIDPVNGLGLGVLAYVSAFCREGNSDPRNFRRRHRRPARALTHQI